MKAFALWVTVAREAWSAPGSPRVAALPMYLVSYPTKCDLPPVQPGHHDLHRVRSLRSPRFQELLVGRALSKAPHSGSPIPLSSSVV